MKSIQPTRPGSVDRLLTIQQAAAYLNVPARTLGEKARLREVPFTRIFKHIRFTPADIAEIIAKGREGIMAPLDSPRYPSSGRGVL
jgi:excisionase family DNA binding protein